MMSFGKFCINKSYSILIASVLLLAYLISIIFISNLGQNRLVESRNSEFYLKVSNRASTLSYFFNLTKEDINRLSQDRVFITYFSNKALGMSLKYGLEANLGKINSTLNDYKHSKTINNIKIFDEIVLLDNENNFISKSTLNLSENIKSQISITHHLPSILVSIIDNKIELFIAKSILSNDIKIGTILTKLNLQESLVNILNSTNINSDLFLKFENNLIDISNLTIIHKTIYHDLKNDMQYTNHFLTKEITNTPLSIVADNHNFIKDEIFTSKKFILILSLLTLFVFLGIIYLVRLNNKNFFLSTEMSLTKKLNEELEDRVKEKTQELQTLNSELKQRVQIEVEKNQENQRILYHQSKMAVMGEMLGNIAHQWRQPLSSISTHASGVKVQKELGILSDDDLAKSMNDIVDSVNFLSDTINDFRNFFNSNRDKTEFSIKDAYDKTFKMLSSRFKNNNIQLIKNIDDIKTNGYENELIQVLLNILNNAHDALIENKIENKIVFIDVYKEHENIVIKIKDNAKGIPQEIIEKIFNPYFTTKADSDGTGIGLYMTQEIIKNHMKGDIIVSNVKYEFGDDEYVGAEFIIKISLEN